MKRSMVRFGVVFGSAALLAFAAGCSHEPKHAAQQPTPGFESQVGTPGTEQQPGMTGTEPGMTGSQPGMTSGQTGQMGGQTGQMGGQTGQMGGQTGMTGQPMGAGTGGETAVDETAICTDLSQQARMRVEDVQGGVAFVLTPKQSGNLATVRDTAHRVERGVQQPAGAMTGGGMQGGAMHCDLFTIGRMQGVNTSIVEGQDAIRIVMTSNDQTQVNKLRQRGRDLSNRMGKGGSMSGQQGGTMPQTGTMPQGGGMQQGGSQY